MKKLFKITITVLMLIGSCGHASVDFSGKTITWIIPFSEGGGTSSWARFYAPRLSQALPGKPTIALKFIPGMASIRGANYFSSDAIQADGLTILGTSASTQFPYLLDDPRVRYDYQDWHIVLASATGGVVYLPGDLGAKWKTDPESILNTQFLYASQGVNRLDLVSLLAFEMLGFKVEPIFGIRGRHMGHLMFKRGDVNLDFQTSSAFISEVKPLVKKGEAVPIMSWGILDKAGNLVRDPTFPDLPTFKEVYTQLKGHSPKGEAWDAWKAFFIAGFSAQKMLVLPENTAPDIVDTYIEAFRKVMASPDFNEDSTQQLGMYRQSTGETARNHAGKSLQIDPKTMQWLKHWVKDRYGVRL